jgi:hypothetical protein
MVRSRSRHLKASNKPGRAALVCRIVSFGALAIFIAAHLEGDPHRAFTALAADPRTTCERQEATQGCCWSRGDAAADQRQAYQGGQEEGREGPRLLALGSGHDDAVGTGAFATVPDLRYLGKRYPSTTAPIQMVIMQSNRYFSPHCEYRRFRYSGIGSLIFTRSSSSAENVNRFLLSGIHVGRLLVDHKCKIISLPGWRSPSTIGWDLSTAHKPPSSI